jgi:archaellum component FlaC
MKQILFIVALLGYLTIPSFCAAVTEQSPRISDREILERLTRIEEGQKARFDAIDKRFEDINNHINRLSSIFAAIVVAVIGFAIWDRRTMVRPFEDKIKRIDADIADNRSKLNALLEALRDLSKTDKKVAELLNKFNLL